MSPRGKSRLHDTAICSRRNRRSKTALDRELLTRIALGRLKLLTASGRTNRHECKIQKYFIVVCSSPSKFKNQNCPPQTFAQPIMDGRRIKRLVLTCLDGSWPLFAGSMNPVSTLHARNYSSSSEKVSKVGVLPFRRTRWPLLTGVSRSILARQGTSLSKTLEHALFASETYVWFVRFPERKLTIWMIRFSKWQLTVRV